MRETTTQLGLLHCTDGQIKELCISTHTCMRDITTQVVFLHCTFGQTNDFYVYIYIHEGHNNTSGFVTLHIWTNKQIVCFHLFN